MKTKFKKLFSFLVSSKNIRLFDLFIKPKSQEEDRKRVEFILNIILLGSIFLSFFAFIKSIVDFDHPQQILSIVIVSVTFLIFLGLYILSRKGFFKLSSHILISIYLISATYTIYNWGVEVSSGLLIYALVVVMSGILINTKTALRISIAIITILLFLGFLQTNSIIIPDLGWRRDSTSMGNIITFSAILGVITIISWLSNREIEKSLHRARTSESLLKEERDLLEVKVEERTRELKQAQEEKALQMYRFAEFGRMASGIFHDLTNPLTAISLNMEKINKEKDAKIKEDTIHKMTDCVRHMKDFTDGAKKQIQNQEIRKIFSLADEIYLATQMLSYKAKVAKVDTIFNPPNVLIQTQGSPIKFYRAVSDLITNAIDAYENTGKKEGDRKVLISLSKKDGVIYVSVRDWGMGIKRENIDKIFEPLFTTKGAEKGTGLGLSICKDVAEKDFGGEVKVESKLGEGATFTIILPAKI